MARLHVTQMGSRLGYISGPPRLNRKMCSRCHVLESLLFITLTMQTGHKASVARLNHCNQTKFLGRRDMMMVFFCSLFKSDEVLEKFLRVIYLTMDMVLHQCLFFSHRCASKEFHPFPIRAAAGSSMVWNDDGRAPSSSSAGAKKWSYVSAMTFHRLIR